jgi:hypothetical protein
LVFENKTERGGARGEREKKKKEARGERGEKEKRRQKTAPLNDLRVGGGMHMSLFIC